jgi:predicted phage terminase large subunit-like protein
MLTADTIAGFSGSLLQKNFDGAVESPACHYEWWQLCCDPKSPLVAIAAPRNHAKSTAISFTYTLATLVFRERSYCLLVSDTVAQATQFLGDIKRELADNERLRELFGIKDFEKESEDDIIVTCTDGHKFRVQAKGSEQKVRGLKWDKKRPDLIVCDDLENDEIVMNKDRREKFRHWFYSALLPCRSVHGIVRYVGTILHTDAMLERLMPPSWDKKNTLYGELVTSSKKKIKGWTSIKYKAHNEDFTHILWPQRWPKQKLLEERQSYLDDGLGDKYSQEYLNVPIDDSVAYFKRPDFLPMSKEDLEKIKHYYITADLAISEADRADYSVFLVAGIDENRKLHIVDVIRDRLDGREIVDLILSLERAWRPEAIGIEEMQVSKAIGPFLREEMVSTGIYPSIIMLKHGGKDKIARARSIQARMRAHAVKFNVGADWYPIFEEECCTFPRSKHDDQVDAFAYLGMMLDKLVEAPTHEEIEEEEYQDELRLSEYGESGRSNWTGY